MSECEGLIVSRMTNGISIPNIHLDFERFDDILISTLSSSKVLNKDKMNLVEGRMDSAMFLCTFLEFVDNEKKHPELSFGINQTRKDLMNQQAPKRNRYGMVQVPC